ncbi:MAG: hypothetical protein WCV71_04180 [Patescibacteria group bacterium]|jgi:hypothetical protein
MILFILYLNLSTVDLNPATAGTLERVIKVLKLRERMTVNVEVRDTSIPHNRLWSDFKLGNQLLILCQDASLVAEVTRELTGRHFGLPTMHLPVFFLDAEQMGALPFEHQDLEAP